MRFSLAHLLLAFPAVAIAMLTYPWVLPGRLSRCYTFDAAATDVQAIRAWAEFQSIVAPNQLDQDSLLAVVSPTDPWGNRYQVVDRFSIGGVGSSCTLHVFSCGADGMSSTNGNDPDDINSWDYDRSAFYGRSIVNDDRWYDLWKPIIVSTALYVALVFGFCYTIQCFGTKRRLEVKRE